MARPTNRADLLTAGRAGHEKLQALLDGLPAAAACKDFAFEDRDRNIRDVLWHLHVWHEMVLDWHRIGTLELGTPAVPGEGYTWQTLPALNQKVWEQAQDRSLDEARAAFEATHRQVMQVIESHDDDELFARGRYAWTKSTTLGAYFISATSSHYDWAMKKVRKHKRTCTA